MSFLQKYKTPKVFKAFGDKNQFLIKYSRKRKAHCSQLTATKEYSHVSFSVNSLLYFPTF